MIFHYQNGEAAWGIVINGILLHITYKTMIYKGNS